MGFILRGGGGSWRFCEPCLLPSQFRSLNHYLVKLALSSARGRAHIHARRVARVHFGLVACGAVGGAGTRRRLYLLGVGLRLSVSLRLCLRLSLRLRLGLLGLCSGLDLHPHVVDCSLALTRENKDANVAPSQQQREDLLVVVSRLGRWCEKGMVPDVAVTGDVADGVRGGG